MSIDVNGAYVYFVIPIFGGIPISQTTVSSFIVMILLCTAFILLGRNLTKRPGKMQVLVEKGVGMITELTASAMGAHNVHWAPFMGCLFLCSLFGSYIGMTGFLRSSTADLNCTATWALMVSFIIWFNTIKKDGIGKFLKNYINPMNIISDLAQPLSMSFRHFSNVSVGIIISTIIISAIIVATIIVAIVARTIVTRAIVARTVVSRTVVTRAVVTRAVAVIFATEVATIVNTSARLTTTLGNHNLVRRGCAHLFGLNFNQRSAAFALLVCCVGEQHIVGTAERGLLGCEPLCRARHAPLDIAIHLQEEGAFGAVELLRREANGQIVVLCCLLGEFLARSEAHRQSQRQYVSKFFHRFEITLFLFLFYSATTSPNTCCR